MKHLFQISVVFLITISAAEGAKSREGIEAENRLHSSTPLRVLLDRRPSLELSSALDGIYVNDGTGWKRRDKTLRVDIGRLLPGPRNIRINGKASTASHIYFRAGTRPSDTLRYEGREYQGAIKISLWKDRLLVTNLLPLEDYLMGTLGAEMSPSWELEALKAQAVAARTYALYMMRHPKSSLYDLERSTQDQVYAGAGKESPRVAKAVQSTRGEYLSLEDRPIKAFFHSRCGGQTEAATAVWAGGVAELKKGVLCPFCQKHPGLWKTQVEQSTLRKNLALPEGAELSLRVMKRTPSGRIQQMRVASGPASRTISGDEFRALLGYTRIKSANFSWKQDHGQLEVTGVGSGHGVGMCQWGARHLAQSGKTYREILDHYYPRAKLEGAPAKARLAAQLP